MNIQTAIERAQATHLAAYQNAERIACREADKITRALKRVSSPYTESERLAHPVALGRLTSASTSSKPIPDPRQATAASLLKRIRAFQSAGGSTSQVVGSADVGTATFSRLIAMASGRGKRRLKASTLARIDAGLRRFGF